MYIHMGMNESIIKLITEPINNMTSNCGHSDCKSKCGNCFELQIDTHQALTHAPRENSNDSMSSSITKIVERHDSVHK
jgi:hypothetical protein